ncbi:MAG: hypothetical protein FWF52_05245 [Candidatus Azobacteroides sp.]|nr:hypothetical protein [Candidatus Azobacteroides sp.]
MAIEIQKTDPYTVSPIYHLQEEVFFGLLDEPFVIGGNIVDVENEEIYAGRIYIAARRLQGQRSNLVQNNGVIQIIERCSVPETHYILPGLVDAHLRMKSTMPTPSLFAAEAVKRGVVAAVIDSDEMIDPMGVVGLDDRIANGESSGFKFFLGADAEQECFDIREAEKKINLGQKVLIRDGGSAANFETLYSLIDQYPSMTMLCADVDNSADLQAGYLFHTFKKGLDQGLHFFPLLKSVSSNAIHHYQLPVGILREGDPADCIIVNNLNDLIVKQTYIGGRLLYDASNA